MPPVKIELPSVVDEIYAQHKQKDHKGHLPLGEHGQPHEHTGPEHIKELRSFNTLLVESIPLPMVQDKIIQGKKSKEIEPWIDDPRLEIHVWKEGPAISQCP